VSRAVHTFPARVVAGTPPPAAPTSYVQTFAVPDTTWTVTHPLGTTTPEVVCYSADGHWLGDADVYVPDANTVIVSWAVPVAGRAKIGI
jgi:hypothetical protein